MPSVRHKQHTHILRAAGAANDKVIAAIGQIPMYRPNIWRSGSLLHIYKLSSYITKKKKKLGRKQPFQPEKKPLESIPVP